MMRRTTLSDAAIPFLLAAAIVYALLRISYESLPPLRWYIALPLTFLAAAELWIAGRVRAVVRHRPGARPVTALAIARAVALAKSSVLVGAGMAGAASGLALHVLPDVGAVSAARHDMSVAAIVLGASLAVAVAGYVLERSAIDPHQRGPHADD